MLRSVLAVAIILMDTGLATHKALATWNSVQGIALQSTRARRLSFRSCHKSTVGKIEQKTIRTACDVSNKISRDQITAMSGIVTRLQSYLASKGIFEPNQDNWGVLIAYNRGKADAATTALLMIPGQTLASIRARGQATGPYACHLASRRPTAQGQSVALNAASPPWTPCHSKPSSGSASGVPFRQSSHPRHGCGGKACKAAHAW